MRNTALLSLGLALVACGQPPMDDGVNPPPLTRTYDLEGTPKPVAASCGSAPGQAKPGDLWAARGDTVDLTIRALKRSPEARGVRVIVSDSSDVSVDPRSTEIDGNGSVTLKVTVSTTASNQPFFYVYGEPYDKDKRTLPGQPRLNFCWEINKPPTTP
jgi:hypothetical protein